MLEETLVIGYDSLQNKNPRLLMKRGLDDDSYRPSEHAFDAHCITSPEQTVLRVCKPPFFQTGLN